jgi:site-specific DNA-methyltransferase (adenine-specific)
MLDNVNNGTGLDHPTIKHIWMVEKCVSISSKENDLILDPFLGSGTTAVACQKLKRNYIGIEIENKYCEIARQRLRQQVLL